LSKLNTVKFILQKTVVLVCFLVVLSFINAGAQDVKVLNENSKKWFIVLPLRFTQLQNTTTMLSGIKIGRSLNSELNASISIYHSFYLNSFKAEANVSGFTEQPRLFINGMATEVEYSFIKKQKITYSAQLLIGWGFMKYDAKEHDFKSKQVNYVILEPAVQVDFLLNNNTAAGLGIGYRPILSSKKITYNADTGNGALPIAKDFPNGINIILTLKGFL
jgi:hypothetical protein